MTENGYPKKFVEKAISKQLKRSALGPKHRSQRDQSANDLVTVSIAFMAVMSQDVRGKDAIRLDRSEKSALAQHAHDQPFTHVIDWSTVPVIDTARQTKE